MKAWAIFGKAVLIIVILVWGLATSLYIEPILDAATTPLWVTLGIILSMASGMAFPILLILGALGVDDETPDDSQVPMEDEEDA